MLEGPRPEGEGMRPRVAGPRPGGERARPGVGARGWAPGELEVWLFPRGRASRSAGKLSDSVSPVSRSAERRLAGEGGGGRGP